MKLVVLALFALVAVSALTPDEEARLLFNTWVKQHGKSYNTVEETFRRFDIFQQNLAFVTKHNQEAAEGQHSYTLGMNKFADLTNAEYRALYLGYNANHTSNLARRNLYHPPLSALPTSVDWRTKGVVTGVKDQGQCGSCWSFSAVGSIEGAHALSTGSLVSLSEQNLVDCVQGGSYNCQTGGIMQDGFQYVITSKGIEGETDYPYCACSGNKCKFTSSKVRATISSYKNVAQGSESALQTAVANQPGVSIAIDASSMNFQLYSGGVFDYPSCSSTMLDHGVLAVGYGTSGKDYWLVKNSWGGSWGLQGYIWMARNKNNQCGVATDASFALV